jgi:thioredoxin reductase (NADPH)
MAEDRDLIVVGAGPAGLAAGLYGSRLGLQTVVVGETLGGMASEAWLVENYPGVESMRGMELAERMRRQAEDAGAEFLVPERVERLELQGEKKRAVCGSSTLRSDAVIVATGCCHRTLGIPGEAEFRGRGVSYCAVCDGVFFKGRKVLVVGGGNTAAMEALYLREIAAKVTMAHRRGDLRADAKLKSRVLSSGIEVLWNKQVVKIQGEKLVNGVVLRDAGTGAEMQLPVDGVFIAVGESPQSHVAKNAGVVTTEEGFIQVNRRQETNVKGVYAAGDVTGAVHQIGVAVGEGITAAINAYLHIMGGWYGSETKPQAPL